MEQERAGGPTIFSVGHGARPLEAFLQILGSAGVRLLVDVRTAPGSRKHPQFGKAELAAALESEGIEYVWLKELGGWRRPHPRSVNTSLRSAGFRGYADHMQDDEFDRAVGLLIDAARRTPAAVMCAESLWWRCHRRLLADALLARGCTVVHLMDGGRTEPHRLHPAARVEGWRVVYDLEQPEQERLA